ncbi:MAG: hypothetical protein WBQ57_07930 [Rhodanobacteraceae bacterium]
MTKTGLIRLCRLLGLIVLGTAALAPMAAATTTFVRVGGGAGCDTSNLAGAIAAASTSPNDTTVIGLVNDQTYAGLNLAIDDRNIDLQGGYARCGDALPGSTRTVISGATNRGSVFQADVTGARRIVALRGVEITNGTPNGIGLGGGGCDSVRASIGQKRARKQINPMRKVASTRR